MLLCARGPRQLEVCRILLRCRPTLAHVKDAVKFVHVTARSVTLHSCRRAQKGRTALQRAAAEGEVEVVQLLLLGQPELADVKDRVSLAAAAVLPRACRYRGAEGQDSATFGG